MGTDRDGSGVAPEWTSGGVFPGACLLMLCLLIVGGDSPLCTGVPGTGESSLYPAGPGLSRGTVFVLMWGPSWGCWVPSGPHTGPASLPEPVHGPRASGTRPCTPSLVTRAMTAFHIPHIGRPLCLAWVSFSGTEDVSVHCLRGRMKATRCPCCKASVPVTVPW